VGLSLSIHLKGWKLQRVGHCLTDGCYKRNSGDDEVHPPLQTRRDLYLRQVLREELRPFLDKRREWTISRAPSP
jgi:hypothetical protein